MYKTLRCSPELFTKDLSGKIYIITGANSGVGLETTRQLLTLGAKVIMACRRTDAAEKVAKTMATLSGCIEVMALDLASLNSVRAFASKFLETHQRLDALVNNAGLASFSLAHSKDGFELMFGVNHLGHFLLTELLLDRLKSTPTSRIINLSSLVHTGRPKNRFFIHFEDLNYEKRAFNGLQAYGESKLANILHAKELATRLERSGVTAVSVHPGWARSNLAGKGAIGFIQNVLLVPFGPLLTILSNKDGAQTSLHCLLDDDIFKHNGAYFSQNGLLYPDKACRAGGWPMTSPNEHARSAEMAKRLYNVSLELVGLKS